MRGKRYCGGATDPRFPAPFSFYIIPMFPYMSPVYRRRRRCCPGLFWCLEPPSHCSGRRMRSYGCSGSCGYLESPSLRPSGATCTVGRAQADRSRHVPEDRNQCLRARISEISVGVSWVGRECPGRWAFPPELRVRDTPRPCYINRRPNGFLENVPEKVSETESEDRK